MKPTPPGAADQRPVRRRNLPAPSFRSTPEDAALIRQIVARAVKLNPLLAPDTQVEPMDMSMDITACHCNGCRLRLTELLEADDANFGHDVFGIRRFIDRTTGMMDPGKFWPRFAMSEARARVEYGV